MKKGIHPIYHDTAKTTCACGTVFEIGSTAESMHIELCSHCHPFYTGGGQRIIDTAGRVDRFKKRAAKATNTATKKRQSTVERKVAAKESRTLKAQGEAIKKKLADKK